MPGRPARAARRAYASGFGHCGAGPISAAQTPSERAAALRLRTARALAWALLIGGWLVLGALGHTRLPLWAGGLAPLALWLAATGLALHLGRQRVLSAAALRGVLGLAGGLTSAGLWASAQGGGAGALAVAAVGWGVLLVAASRAVRLLRSAVAPARPPAPVGAAATGGALAWGLAVAPQAGSATLTAPATVLAPLVAAALLAALLPRAGASRGCHAGLFDCALPGAPGAADRGASAWATVSARWAMLPMMALLAAMADWCSEWGIGPAASAALHLGAMLLPPLAVHAWRGQGTVSALGADTAVRAGIVAAMVAGGAAALCLPGLQGLMAASLCHAAAWGLAWTLSLSAPAARPSPSTGDRRPAPPSLAAALAPAGVVGLLGLALADWGPQAGLAVHAVLGIAAAAGVLCRAARHAAVRPGDA